MSFVHPGRPNCEPDKPVATPKGDDWKRCVVGIVERAEGGKNHCRQAIGGRMSPLGFAPGWFDHHDLRADQRQVLIDVKTLPAARQTII